MMQPTFKAALGALSLAFAASSAQALPITVYETDFEAGLDSNWSGASITNDNAVDGTDLTAYNGNYSRAQNTTLTLTGLGAHSQIALEFDLYLFATWDGNDGYWGPDFFSLAGDVEGAWTFTNHQSEGQSYPGAPDETYSNGNRYHITHVYRDLGPTGADDEEFVVNHIADTFSVTFGGPTTQSDEWWGIDNVRVSVDSVPVSEPSSLALLGLGLLGLAGARKGKA